MDVKELIDECDRVAQVLGGLPRWLTAEIYQLYDELEDGSTTIEEAKKRIGVFRQQSDLLNQSLCDAVSLIMGLRDQTMTDEARRIAVGHLCRNELTGSLELLRLQGHAYMAGVEAVEGLHRKMLATVGLE